MDAADIAAALTVRAFDDLVGEAPSLPPATAGFYA